MNDYYNGKHYYDSTAGEAIKNIEAKDKEEDKKVSYLVSTLKRVADLAGFEFVGRIQIKNKWSGKEYK